MCSSKPSTGVGLLLNILSHPPGQGKSPSLYPCSASLEVISTPQQQSPLLTSSSTQTQNRSPHSCAQYTSIRPWERLAFHSVWAEPGMEGATT